MALTFKIDWLEAPGVKAPELAATWASLGVWVGEECVSQVEDATSTRRSIYCSVYPLAEWIVFNWWFLQADTRLPTVAGLEGATPAMNGAWAGWRRRHNLRCAGEGFPWPDLELAPEGDHVRVRWRADWGLQRPRRVRYLASGEAFVETSTLTESLGLFVESVLARLEDCGVTESALGEEWAAIGALDREEADFCLAAGRLAVDPYAIDPPTESSILEAEASLDARVLEDFLDAVDPKGIRSGLSWIERGTHKLRDSKSESNLSARKLSTLRATVIDSAELSGEPPWARGYRQADWLREYLKHGATTRLEVDAMVPVMTLAGREPALEGLAGFSGTGSPSLVLGRPLNANYRRFAQARALWHLVGPDGEDRSLVTNSSSGRQKTARAFAAELLAPARGIAEMLEGADVVDQDTTEQVASHFRVSPLLIQHQIDNQLSARWSLARP